MLGVSLALLSAVLFGATSVAMGFAVRRGGDPEAGAVITSLAGFLICGAVSLSENWQGSVWPFFLIGLVAPGGSQLLFTFSVRDAGPARTSVIVGAAPLVSVSIALIFLGEPLQAALAVGAILIVAGGLTIAAEGTRPEHIKAIGVVFALLATVLFATRDALVRWLATSSTVPSLLGATCSLLSSTVLLSVYLAVARRSEASATFVRGLRPWGPAAILWGASYVALFEAFYHARVSVVSPLVATESLFGVVLAMLLLRHSERVGRHVLAGAILIVAGGALIGAFR
jgi:drug/metabolite transporter (DMT)-like permease